MDQLKEDCLRRHNELRGKHGVGPLTLDQQVELYVRSIRLNSYSVIKSLTAI